jgi:RHS repeat-associated protein
LNRLASASNAGTDCTQSTLNGKTKSWASNYTYDAWANLTDKTKTKCGGEDIHFALDGGNRLHVLAGADYAYDGAGNMTSNANTAQGYTYDPENRINVAGGFTYAYDKSGNRVKKANGTSGTLYWYMLPGIVAETDLSGNLQSEYIFLGGQLVARRDGPTGAGGVSYYIADHLKTTNIVTDAAGNIKNESDYYPWGGELQLSASDSNHYKFAGKERDTETQLDYFGARYYFNAAGRFATPDWAARAASVPYAEFGDPQSLNLYTYVRNTPMTTYDLDGHDFAKVWEDIKEGLSQISVKATIGLGIGGKVASVKGVKVRAEAAVKANVEFSGPEGKVKVSQSVEVGVTAGANGKQVGLGVSAEQVKVSVDARTGEVHGSEPPTGEKVVGISSGDKSAGGNDSGKVTLLGAEEGEVALGGGEISISQEGVNAFKSAISDLKETLFPDPPPPPPTPAGPACLNANKGCVNDTKPTDTKFDATKQ